MGAQVSNVVPSPTQAPILAKLGISTAPLPMKAPRRTMAPGTARKPALVKSLASQPLNFDGTLSHQWAAPGAPEMASMGLRRKLSRIAFFNHWVKRQPYGPFLAHRDPPASSAHTSAPATNDKP